MLTQTHAIHVQAQAGVDAGLNVDSAAKLSRAVQAGMTEIAEGLAKAEMEWLNHSLGNVSDIRAAAEKAAEKHGADAAAKLRAEADKLFEAGSTATVPLKNVGKVEEAIFKWRVALWLLMGDGSSENLPAYCAWSVIDSRYNYWKEVRPELELNGDGPQTHAREAASLSQ